MSQDEEKQNELERQLHLSNVRMLLWLDQSGLLQSSLSSALRMQLRWEYRKANRERGIHKGSPFLYEYTKNKNCGSSPKRVGNF